MPSLPEDHVLALRSLTMENAIRFWDGLEAAGKKENTLSAVVRELCRADLFYLLVRACRRIDMLHPWIYARCREVEADPHGHLDLWAREHYKSTIITFGLTIQDILKDPNITIGIFSHTRPIAKAFLRQIMRELEGNAVLHSAFPDILWGKDVRQAPKWALASDTPILTTEGWVNHGDLRPGDKIFGSHGQVIKVTGNSGPMMADCRRVVFDDSELIASSDHLWPVECKKSSSWSDSEVRIFKTDALPKSKTKRMLATPIIHPPTMERASLDPYILGLWLGDGTAGTNIISMHRDDEAEALDLIALAGFESYKHRRKDGDNFSMFGLRGLKEILAEIGCLKRKYIPRRYLLGSANERLALLQGLMDSDGTCKKAAKNRCAGMCMFSNTNKDLADGVFHLAASLGLRPSILDFMPKSVGKKRVYHVYFVGVRSIPPFRLSRKLQHCKIKRHKVGRYLRSIEKTENVIVNCIKVDAPDSLYLAGRAMIPTHNSEDDGIIVRRSSNPNEATIEAWGLVDGQPTSKHFQRLHYDDIVVQASVTTPEMIEKTMTALEQSYNLGTMEGTKSFAGTRWHFNDAYRTISDRGTVKTRTYPGTDDGTEHGNPVLVTTKRLAELRRDMGPHVFHAQILLNPKADALQGFKREWVHTYTKISHPERMNKYLLVDAASSKKKGSDYTAIWVIGLATDGNYYALDMVRDRLNLTERADRVFALHRKWKPKQVRYEKYGLMADIEHLKSRMETDTYRFDIIEVGGQTKKEDRIGRLIPIFEQGRFYLPKSFHVTDYQKVVRDLVRDFVEEELVAFPVGIHDDSLDSLSRIAEPDLKLVWPQESKTDIDPPRREHSSGESSVSWMAG